MQVSSAAIAAPSCRAQKHAVPAGRSTQGLRNSPSSRGLGSTVEVASASDYSAALEGAQILMATQQRSELIWRDTLSAAAEVRGTVPESARADLLQEVTHLVESPRVLRGSFNAGFLKLPRSAPASSHCSNVPQMSA